MGQKAYNAECAARIAKAKREKTERKEYRARKEKLKSRSARLADEGKRRMGKVAQLDCAICRRLGFPGSQAEVHHVRTGTGAGRRGDGLIPLCPLHHRLGNDALHVMGRKAWERNFGVTELELAEETDRRINGNDTRD